jgi:outer membrane protein OmpA-like peptidoglycan-associated protein
MPSLGHASLATSRTASPARRRADVNRVAPYAPRRVSRAACACGGTCPGCNDGRRLQAKLAISQPGDAHEREADQVADQVMRMAAPSELADAASSHQPQISRMRGTGTAFPSVLQRENGTEEPLPEDEPEMIAAKSGIGLSRAADAPGPMTAPPIVHDVLRSPGQPLDAATRGFMESRLGTQLGDVRVHTDADAQESARSVGALAYTVGQHVVFGAQQYAPSSSAGQRLLAHELVHTMQQSHDDSPPPAYAAQGSAANTADAGTAGGSARAAGGVHAAARTIQRMGDPSKIPADMPAGCEIAANSPIATAFTLFANNASALTPLQQAEIDRFVAGWTAAGANTPVRVDGYASTPGSQELNWRLSCNRAQAVVAELMTPSNGIPGIPASFIRSLAQGETDEFGAEAENRRVSISAPTPLPPQPPQPTTCPGGAQAEPRIAVCIQPIVVAETDGSAPLAAPSFASVTGIWGKCCLEVTVNDAITVANSDLKEIDDAGSGAPMTAEETTLFATAGSTCIPVAIVDTIRRGAAAGKNVAGGGTTKDFGTNQPKVILVEGVDPTVVAHEVGHALTLEHTDDVGGRTVMHPSGAFDAPVPDGVTADICTKARAAPINNATVAESCCEQPIT